jgi:uncharacterized protein YbjT (DUF2867 family)
MATAPATRFAVIGATGQQGGAVADALLDAGVSFRAIVRDPVSPNAMALRDRGADIVVADQDEPASLRRALAGVESLFFMTSPTGPDGFEGEATRGIAVADAAAAAGVTHVVYSSVGGAERHSGIPHFESKRLVEEHLSGLIPSRFVRPTFFMENLRGQLAAATEGELVLRLPVSPATPLQMIAVRDIGRAAAALLLDPNTIDGEGVEIAGDELTMTDVAATVSRVFGRPARFESLPLLPTMDEDRLAMFRWFEASPSYRADFGTTRRLVRDPLDLTTWLAQLAAA